MFAQIATVFLGVASLEAAWGWQLLLEPDLEAIWKRFRWVLNQFWLPSWTKLGPKWLTTFSLDPKFGMLRQPAETTCSLRRYFCLLVLLLTYFMNLLATWVLLSGPAECAERLQLIISKLRTSKIQTTEIFKLPKNRKDGSDFDDFRTKKITSTRPIFWKNYGVAIDGSLDGSIDRDRSINRSPIDRRNLAYY